MTISQGNSETYKKQVKKQSKADIIDKKPVEKIIEPVAKELTDSNIEKVCNEQSIDSEDRIQNFMNNLLEMKKQIANLIDEFKKIQKEKKKPKNKNIKSGFVKEVNVTPLLAEFVGIKNNDLISRVNVTKYVTEYIKSNDLQVESNKQYFKVNEKLANLLGVNENDEIHYFKLQAHLKNHYPKIVNV